jgi:predicted DNA-binding protein YlxM (UPF0122 family)
MVNQQVRDTKTYKQVPFAEDYLINMDGEIYSNKSHKTIQPTPHKGGYLRVKLFCNDGKRKAFLLHRVVAETFLDNPDNYPEVNHKDGNKQNNNVSNLEWLTREQNMTHAFLNGLNSNAGERNGKARLTESQVIEIYQMLLDGKLVQEIASKFDVRLALINKIKRKEIWRGVLKDLPCINKRKYRDKLTKQLVEQIKVMRNNGETCLEISKALDLSIGQVEAVFRKNGTKGI